MDTESHTDSGRSDTQPRSRLNPFYRTAWDHTIDTARHKSDHTATKTPNIHNHPPLARKETTDSPALRSSLGSEVDREHSEVVVHAGRSGEKRHHHRHHHHHKHRGHGEERHARHQRY